MSKKQLEEKYQIIIDEKNENLFFVFNKDPKILLFIAPSLSDIDKSMKSKSKSEI